jgi:hypothetical protein
MPASEELAHALRRVSGTDLDEAGAANAWAGTDGLDLLGALNAKAGNTTNDTVKGLLGVLNQLAGTIDLDVNGAAAALI